MFDRAENSASIAAKRKLSDCFSWLFFVILACVSNNFSSIADNSSVMVSYRNCNSSTFCSCREKSSSNEWFKSFSGCLDCSRVSSAWLRSKLCFLMAISCFNWFILICDWLNVCCTFSNSTRFCGSCSENVSQFKRDSSAVKRFSSIKICVFSISCDNNAKRLPICSLSVLANNCSFSRRCCKDKWWRICSSSRAISSRINAAWRDNSFSFSRALYSSNCKAYIFSLKSVCCVSNSAIFCSNSLTSWVNFSSCFKALSKIKKSKRFRDKSKSALILR